MRMKIYMLLLFLTGAIKASHQDPNIIKSVFPPHIEVIEYTSSLLTTQGKKKIVIRSIQNPHYFASFQRGADGFVICNRALCFEGDLPRCYEEKRRELGLISSYSQEQKDVIAASLITQIEPKYRSLFHRLLDTL